MKVMTVRSLGLFVCGVMCGTLLGAPRVRQVFAQARTGGPPAPMDLPALQAEVERLRSIAPTQSHVMADIATQYASLWFAGQRRNWPLATYYFNETRGRLQWAVRINPTPKVAGSQETVDLKGIFDGIDTGSLAPLKKAIDDMDSIQFAAAYKVMLESCYSCHKSTGRLYLRPMVPRVAAQPIINSDPAAAWPQ